MEWLFRSDFNTSTTLALWTIAAVLCTTLILFVYTMGLRVATLAADQRRDKFMSRWRDVFATTMMSPEFAAESDLPWVRPADRIDLLEEWNRACSMVEGSADDNLIVLARRTGIPELATRMLNHRRTSSKILAVQTMGNLREGAVRDRIAEFVNDRNTALSITAAVALVQIDADFGIALVVPLINSRRDWPKNRVSILLRLAGTERISEPLYRAIRSGENPVRTYLLQFARLIESEARDSLVEDLLRESNDPGVLGAALKLVSGFGGVPRIAALTQHDAWHVRMQAAKVLGRIGQPEHLSFLESLLSDREWWVRYRAAQSITLLPFLGPNQLRALRHRQDDPYASDILQQTYAEAGLA